MFKNCSSLTSIDLSGWNTSKADNMNCFFQNCFKLKSIDLSNFNTRRVLYISNFFTNCTPLTSVKLNFNTTRVNRMSYMFANCTSLKSLNFSTFRTDKCNSFSGIFENDFGLDLYLTKKTCNNLRKELPSYVNVHDI